MTHRDFRTTAAVLAAVLGLALAGPAPAADGDGAESGASEQGSANANVSTEQLEKFAEAYGQIRSVRAKYAGKIRKADDKQERTELKKQGREEMVSAIQSAGLQVAEYRRIGQKLNGSKQLQSRLRTLMQQNEGSGSGQSGS